MSQEYTNANLGGFASSPRVGFATDARRGEKLVSGSGDGWTQSAGGTAGYDKEHGRGAHDVERRTQIALQISRRISPGGKGNDWKGFARNLRSSNGHSIKAIEPTRYRMDYVTAEESEKMLAGVLGARRQRSERAELAIVRCLRDKINRFIEQEVDREQAYETSLYEADADLALRALERRYDPDNPKWHDQAVGVSRQLPTTEGMSLWLPADFEVKPKFDSSVADKVSLTLEDSSGVLHSGRNRLIDVLGDKFGMDVSGVSEQWQPQVDILQTTGGRDASQLKGLRVPGWPLIMPLRAPQIHEV
jgi:hypothetical protein